MRSSSISSSRDPNAAGSPTKLPSSTRADQQHSNHQTVIPASYPTSVRGAVDSPVRSRVGDGPAAAVLRQAIPKLASGQNQQLLVTLTACLDEVRKLDFRNAELERNLKKAEMQVEQLTQSLSKAEADLAEKNALEDANLRLQARLLSLERTASGGANSNLVETLEAERQLYKNLEGQYKILETYYNELLRYVRESESQTTASGGSTSEQPNEY